MELLWGQTGGARQLFGADRQVIEPAAVPGCE
jgi:hypothetical protein